MASMTEHLQARRDQILDTAEKYPTSFDGLLVNDGVSLNQLVAGETAWDIMSLTRLGLDLRFFPADEELKEMIRELRTLSGDVAQRIFDSQWARMRRAEADVESDHG